MHVTWYPPAILACPLTDTFTLLSCAPLLAVLYPLTDILHPSAGHVTLSILLLSTSFTLATCVTPTYWLRQSHPMRVSLPLHGQVQWKQ